jgi:hypothetical protein
MVLESAKRLELGWALELELMRALELVLGLEPT